MSQAPIYAPEQDRRGKPRAPDLQNPYRACRKANVVCALEWAPLEPTERAMFLTTMPHIQGGKGYVIPISRLALYVNEDGTSKPGLAEVARKAALRMGLDDTAPTLNLICDVVMGSVNDIRKMPERPPAPH